MSSELALRDEVGCSSTSGTRPAATAPRSSGTSRSWCGAEGATELLTSYVPEDGGPTGFYERLGFEPTGELDNSGGVIVRLGLPSA
jgi:hypothetical protein